VPGLSCSDSDDRCLDTAGVLLPVSSRPSRVPYALQPVSACDDATDLVTYERRASLLLLRVVSGIFRRPPSGLLTR